MRADRGRPRKVLRVSPANQLRLAEAARTHTSSVVRQRARIVLLSLTHANGAVALKEGISVQSVARWRERFRRKGVAGLEEGRPGRPAIKTKRLLGIVRLACRKPRPAPRVRGWSIRTVAADAGVSKTTVWRIYQRFKLRTSRTMTFRTMKRRARRDAEARAP